MLQNAGPLSASGMPEAGYLPIPGKLARAGVKDMVRISDARMSGTAYGTIVLHVTPEAAIGGPLALVRNGDRIRLSVDGAPPRPAGRRRRSWRAARLRRRPRPRARLRRPLPPHVLQADHGCDFDFLRKHPLGPARAGGLDSCIGRKSADVGQRTRRIAAARPSRQRLRGFSGLGSS